VHDLRFAIRQFVKAPGFTAVAVLSLALGIGATTTVFCWIQGILLHPLPGVAQEQEMAVITTIHDKQMWDTVSLPDLSDCRELRDVFAGIIGSQVTPACLTVDNNSEWIYGQVATAGIAIELAMALVTTRLLATSLYGVSPFDLAIFIGVPVLLGLVSVFACWLPARRAARVDPMVALRAE
jgi:ABC-type antimicrobial peptide transport system permease subunit